MTLRQGDMETRGQRRQQGEHRGIGAEEKKEAWGYRSIRAGERKITPAPMHPCTHAVGFTMTELLIVIAIIVMLFGILLTFYRPAQERRKVFECQSRLQVIHRALRLYMLDWDGFPASPYDSLDNDRDRNFDEDLLNFKDDDGDKLIDEDPPDATVGGLLALQGYVRSQRALTCPGDHRSLTLSPNHSSYQGCDKGTGFDPPIFPITRMQLCPQGAPTYAITRFPIGHICHPSHPKFDACPDLANRLRQLGVRNTSPFFPAETFPADDTVMTWCPHHRYIGHDSTAVNYEKGGVPADVVLYWDGNVRTQRMRLDAQGNPNPSENWLRKPDEQ